MRLERRWSSALLLIVLAVAEAAAADVWAVPGDAPDVQSAVDAAGDGAIILVAPSVNPEHVIIAGKGLTLMGDGGAPEFRRIDILDLPTGSTVVLRSLSVQPRSFCVIFAGCVAGPGEAVVVRDALGEVRLEDCTVLGQPGLNGDMGELPVRGFPALTVERSPSVAVLRSVLRGGNGADLEQEDTDLAGDGGQGVLAVESSVWVYDSQVLGGHGGSIQDTVSSPGRDGADAVLNVDGRVLLVGCDVRGGSGGAGDCSGSFPVPVCGAGGSGGDGVQQQGDGSVLLLRHSTPRGGAGGQPGDFDDPHGPAGLPLRLLGGAAHALPGRSRSLVAGSPVRSGETLTVDASGAAGEFVLLWISAGADGALLLGKGGALLVDVSRLLASAVFGPLPLGGALNFGVPLPPLPAAVAGLDLHLQALFAAPGSQLLCGASVTSWVEP